ncbi:dipeptidyl-peptidase-like protein V precursor [Hyaloscypha bicolor E]|uniref:Dipeptidyl-peptidase V n=1 Tax=Hyaloscypha bicolor E TaxID=1095630 RepID=A0A2J6SMJ0_9HELO|nr:dipeptidyl-peptidase-like protein V precursor [Hyaloscypha bicolor E]PMD51991.1 dipeptidyl-peptidase-like protein V precursor [Hyaloscypha bicolor E]
MTIRAKKFTPEVLLSAPRRSSAIPNQKGTLALFTVSTYSFNSHSKSSEIRVLDIKTGQTNLVSSDAQASEPTWLGKKNLILWLKGGEKGTTSLMLTDGDNLELKPATITTFNGPVANLKITEIDPETFALVVTGLATPSGSLYNPETAEKPKSTGRVYSKLFVRQWDSYVTENTSSIWYTTLKIKKSSGLSNMTVGSLRNALAGSSLESPVPPFGGAGDFDASKNGIVFVAKDPKINAANYTKTDLYFIPLDFTKPRAPSPQIVKTGNLKGYSASPVFSPDGNSVAFTRMKSIQYESDKPRLLLIPDITDLTNVQEFYGTPDGEGKWDLRPEAITWSQDGEELYVTAEENGRGKLFKLPASPRHAKDLPKAIVSDGTVTDAKLLPDNQLLISSNSLVDNSTYSILDAETDASSLVSSNSKLGKAFGLSQDQVDEFWFAGAEDYNVHAWVLKPSNFDKSKKYPLAFLIHGGPQGAWNEGWSTRWNPAVFAEQGYVVVTPNPTGSTGYGMEFQNGIKNQWGGRPYIDLVKCFEYIEANISYVDINRAVALGASYGGYMVNWIQGHPLGRKFKALVTHDGVFSTLNQYSSEELFFPHHDFDGTLWDNRENYEKWDPASHLKNWATPHLIIHNELDYRLPIAEGLAPFNVLQTKGIDSKFLTFPDENHWVLKPENSLLWHKEVLGWINKYSRIEEEELNAGVSQVRM